jgi:hypothetical protein
MENRPLNEVIRPSGNLPGVAEQRVLTGGEFGEPASRRIVFLTDGSTIEEQALEREQKETESRFRYLVWNYSTPKGRPVEYAVGEFSGLSGGCFAHPDHLDLLVQAQGVSVSGEFGPIRPLAVSCQFCQIATTRF